MACLSLNIEQAKTPLLTALIDYCQNNRSFHMPAHQKGAAAPSTLLDFIGRETFHLDQTEVPGLDDLHRPTDVIAAAETLAASAFGADKTFFLVNGTSCGIHALLAGSCSPGEKIILPRNMHRSVLWGLIVSGADPVYTPVSCLDGFGVALPIDSRAMAAASNNEPGFAGAMVVNPTYHGLCGDIGGVASVAHRYGKPLFVDEAHGGHLRFHSELPMDAISSGADGAVQSTHKLGGSLTQSSMLHLQGHLVNSRKIADVLSMVQTTSPSYILMASLDAARHQLVTEGHKLLERAIGLASWVREQLNPLKGIDVLGEGHLTSQYLIDYRLDPTKVLISARQLGISGYELSGLLRSKYKIQVEMADFLNVLCMVTIGTSQEDCVQLVSAIKDIAQDISYQGRARQIAELGRKATESTVLVPEKVMTPREAWLAGHGALPLEDAVGKISGEMVAVYPPGIPALLPGELVTAEIAEYLRMLRAMKIPLHGPRDPGLDNLEVLNG